MKRGAVESRSLTEALNPNPMAAHQPALSIEDPEQADFPSISLRIRIIPLLLHWLCSGAHLYI